MEDIQLKNNVLSKKKLICVFLFLLISPVITLAVSGDVTGDGKVDGNDLSIFSSYWLQTPDADPNCDFNEDGSVNFVDFAIMANNWSGGLSCPNCSEPNEPNEPELPQNQIPTANDVNVSVYTVEATSINFVADDNDGDTLVYKIASLPSHGMLTDVSIGAGFISSVPYTILNPKLNYVNYQSEPNYTGSDSFTYKVSDDINDSNIATVTLTVVNNPLDNLSFDGQGFVTVPDSNYIEFTDTFTFAVWIKTKWPYGGIISKRGTSGAGFILKLVDGVPVVCFYDTNGNEKTITGSSNYRVNTGEWTHIAISHDSNETVIYVDSFPVGYMNSVFPGTSFANTANLKFGVGGGQYFKGEIDRISWYETALYEFDVAAAYFLEGRAPGDSFQLLIPDFATRFDLNEGLGVDVNDMTHGLKGVISDSKHIKWMPGNALSQESLQRLRFRERGRFGTFHFRRLREQRD